MKHSEQQPGLSEHSFRQKVQHLGPAPGHPERHRCVLLRPERGTWGQMGLHLRSISGGRKGGETRGSSHESKSRAIWKESQRAVRDEGNEGKDKGSGCTNKRKKGQGRSASLVDLAGKNYMATKNPNCNTEIKWEPLSMEELWRVWRWMRTMEPRRHTKACLSLTSFSLTALGDLQEKWMLLAIMLHAYLV